MHFSNITYVTWDKNQYLIIFGLCWTFKKKSYYSEVQCNTIFWKHRTAANTNEYRRRNCDSVVRHVKTKIPHMILKNGKNSFKHIFMLQKKFRYIKKRLLEAVKQFRIIQRSKCISCEFFCLQPRWDKNFHFLTKMCLFLVF